MKRKVLVFLLQVMTAITVTAMPITGNVSDKKTKEPLVGASVEVLNTNVKAVADIDGNFVIEGLPDGKYDLIVRYISYKDEKVVGVNVSSSEPQAKINIFLDSDEEMLQEVSVVSTGRRNTEKAMLKMAKNSAFVESNVSAQEISRTQDPHVGEVVRRVSGVSLIQDRFVMVRGLSQRYNNVWINGGAVPSSEADSRSFSFDVVPSSQIDNIEIVKTSVPEYPADYTGGFIIMHTKDIPAENSATLSIGGNWNDATDFKDFSYSKGSSTDFLGFDGGLRTLNNGISSVLNSYDNGGIKLNDNGFNNDWIVKNKKPIGDLKVSASLNHRWRISDRTLGLIAAFNYTNESRSYENMQNNLYGIYDVSNDRPNYLRHSIDDQYNNNVRAGAMFNLTLLSKDGNNKYQWKNIFNQLGSSRYTWREGVSAQANIENSAEYYYSSRTTYNTQFTGKHTMSENLLEWNVGYAYANRYLPDRRRYLKDDAIESGTLALTTGNDVSREWTQLDEHIFSGNVSYKHQLAFDTWTPTLRYGLYGEYRTREYLTREFIYNWNADENTLPKDFRTYNIPDLLSNTNNFAQDKLYLLEQVQMRNNYKGNNTLGAGYIAVSLPFGKLGIYTGVRFEYSNLELTSNTKDTEVSPLKRNYKHKDFFPSFNAVYKFDDKNQLRASYGRSVNRPEFREVSSSVFYDFDLASSVQGNTELENCYINNFDLRYEFYPSSGEQITLAAFYKHFTSPIEWTYTVAGGTDLIYSYENAKSANTYGLELDIRKDLSFIGLPNVSWSFNGSIIKSKVYFAEGSIHEDRPMQGQSPYLINTGFFYANPKLDMNVSVLYNRIGKRIVGVGRNESATGNDDNSKIPDSYEMPRNAIDITASKNFGKHWQLKVYVRDLLAEKISYKQFAEVKYANGTERTVEEVTRQYRPGRNLGFVLTYNF